jgi:heme exporter protein A
MKGERMLFRDLCFRVEPGTILQLVGDNGAGKTSLLRLLAGLVAAEVGEIDWCGAPLAPRQSAQQIVHYFGHQLALHPQLSVAENLDFLLALDGIAANQASDCLVELGLAPLANLPVGYLSAGQQRRVALARLACVHHKPLWLLDEPLTALDGNTVRWLTGQLEQHCAAGGMVIFTSHQAIDLQRPVIPLYLGSRYAG